MNIQELQNEEMHCLVAPDGSIQLTTLSPDFATCVAMIKLLYKGGLSKSYHEMCVVGKYKILPIKVSIIQKGTEDKPFRKTIS